MSCELSGGVLHAYLDGELDASRAAEFERHLESCGNCAGELAAQEGLRSSISQAQLYEKAPRRLRDSVLAEIRPEEPRFRTSRWISPAWLAAAAAILLVAGAAWYSLPRLQNGPAPSPVTTAEIIDAHIRSLQPGHLTDVASTDQHTVKPWFDGKLAFIPPVKDFAAEGFPLIGGRLDVLNGQDVAALVYGRRQHIINVFAWPTKEPDTPIHPPGSRQGYQWVHWRRGGMEFCAVSDVSAADLQELAQLIHE